MDALAVAHRRMHNLRLLGASLEAPDHVVGWLGAVQSQDYAPAKMVRRPAYAYRL